MGEKRLGMTSETLGGVERDARTLGLRGAPFDRHGKKEPDALADVVVEEMANKRDWWAHAQHVENDARKLYAGLKRLVTTLRSDDAQPGQIVDDLDGIAVLLADLQEYDANVCPECEQGKHENCDGTALSDADEIVGCTCPDLVHR